VGRSLWRGLRPNLTHWSHERVCRRRHGLSVQSARFITRGNHRYLLWWIRHLLGPSAQWFLWPRRIAHLFVSVPWCRWLRALHQFGIYWHRQLDWWEIWSVCQLWWRFNGRFRYQWLLWQWVQYVWLCGGRQRNHWQRHVCRPLL